MVLQSLQGGVGLIDLVVELVNFILDSLELSGDVVEALLDCFEVVLQGVDDLLYVLGVGLAGVEVLCGGPDGAVEVGDVVGVILILHLQL